jgi:hypothetical protein
VVALSPGGIRWGHRPFHRHDLAFEGALHE